MKMQGKRRRALGGALPLFEAMRIGKCLNINQSHNDARPRGKFRPRSAPNDQSWLILTIRPRKTHFASLAHQNMFYATIVTIE